MDPEKVSSSIQKPLIMDNLTDDELQELNSQYPNLNIIELYQDQLDELKATKYPALENVKKKWILYPWLNKLMTAVDEAAFFYLRTNRNRLLITAIEQEQLVQKRVGIAGLSVGAGIAFGLQTSGISNAMAISDQDIIETTNLNRIPAGLPEISNSKEEFTARKIYEINPYAKITSYGRLTDENIETFIDNVDLIVDEVDDFKIKLKLRMLAKKGKLPLLMATALGDGFIVDVERHDQDDIEPFLGMADEALKIINEKDSFNEEDEKLLATELVGPEHVPKRAKESLMAMGSEVFGRPQLVSTVMADTGFTVFLIRKILLGNRVDSGRYFIEFERQLN